MQPVCITTADAASGRYKKLHKAFVNRSICRFLYKIFQETTSDERFFIKAVEGMLSAEVRKVAVAFVEVG